MGSIGPDHQGERQAPATKALKGPSERFMPEGPFACSGASLPAHQRRPVCLRNIGHRMGASSIMDTPIREIAARRTGGWIRLPRPAKPIRLESEMSD